LGYNLSAFEGRASTVATDNGHILIVDDDATFRAFVSRLLARAGHAIVEAATGEDALEAVHSERPTLVLLDVSLPDISGFEVCCELRDQYGDQFPVIFVSGERTDAGERAVGFLLGGDDYVTKPFDTSEFLARVRRAIARAQPESEPLAAQPLAAPRDFNLSNREFEVLRGLAQGLSSSDIASEMVISPKTVSTHVQRILAKLGVHSRAQAVAVAYQSRLLEASTERAEEGGTAPLPAPRADFLSL
jgi:two-component system nitrate/nitrite response regulator NarL